jgi:hypothetical protein
VTSVTAALTIRNIARSLLNARDLMLAGPLYHLTEAISPITMEWPVVAVGNAFCAFSKELWARSVRPQLRQLPQARRARIGARVNHTRIDRTRPAGRERQWGPAP